ncbi:hypothetical protein ElyMa_000567300 [Elysia marginata]|uniref:Uncharacterized protein n=1 Tax=Elysia marginata TaxID=1093978 RepID=A0AAV4G2I8_9GAST|nr:hypothetical protein ElyMa_000567300 [Elysia marginata]
MPIGVFNKLLWGTQAMLHCLCFQYIDQSTNVQNQSKSLWKFGMKVYVKNYKIVLKDWSVFVDACDYVNELTEHVTDYITFCVENVVEKKEVVVHVYPNNKPWITNQLKTLLDEKKCLFKKGDKPALKSKQREIKEEITRCKEKLEKGFTSNNVRDMWKGLKTVVSYNEKKSTPDINFDLNELNKFYARFDEFDLVKK